MSKDRPILLVDFDGVLHSYTSGWQGFDVIPDKPVPGALKFLRDALEEFDVQIYSARSRKEHGIRAMKTWLIAHTALEINAWTAGWLVDSLKFPVEKPAAFLTIDDRAIQFQGTFPDIGDLLAFKPWNKREV